VVNDRQAGDLRRTTALTGRLPDGYDRSVPLPRLSTLALAIWALALLPARAEGKRFLLDEVVAVVAQATITLSEVRAEARIALIQERGAEAARLEPDRGLLAATLRRMINQRLVLSELDSLRTLETDRADLEAALARFRARVGSPEQYRALAQKLDLTDDEIGQVLSRQLRYARYIDSRVKLSGPAQEGAAELARYQKVTESVLAELRKRVDVRVLDPIVAAGEK
jgi:hypothetical protein